MISALWKFFTSLRLTVVCLALTMVLVFVGTLAQVDEGLWDAQNRWFHAFFVWWHPGGGRFALPVFPAGFLVGSVLLVNLITAHLKRFTWSVRKLGIQLTHLGIILFLLGEAGRALFSQESLLSFVEGQTKSYSEAPRRNELVFVREAANDQEQVVSFSEDLLRQTVGRQELSTPELPLTLRVKEWQPNSQVVGRAQALEAATKLTTALATVEAQFSSPEGLEAQAVKAQETAGRREVWEKALAAIGEKATGDLPAEARRVAAERPKAERLCAELKSRFRGEMLARFGQSGGAMSFAAEKIRRGEPVSSETMPAPATEGDGREAVAFPAAEQRDMDGRNLPYAVVELLEGGKSRGTWLFSPWLDPQALTVGGTVYHAALRFERVYHPFATTLLKTTHETYPGTDIPKNFQSRVRIQNFATGEVRERDIFMNEPLNYSGLKFFQYQMGREDTAGRPNSSTLQVVRNPSWAAPYLACFLVGGGMLYQFLYHLTAFIGKRRTPAAG